MCCQTGEHKEVQIACCHAETNNDSNGIEEAGLPVNQKLGDVEARHCFNSSLDLIVFTYDGADYTEVMHAMTEWLRRNVPEAIVFSINFYINGDNSIVAEMTIER